MEKAVALLPGSPVVDGNRMSSLLKVDVSQAIRTLNTLSEVGILSQATQGKRKRTWLAGEITDMLETYGFSVRSPDGTEESDGGYLSTDSVATQRLGKPKRGFF